jgi:signal transduction histidine kinase
MRRLPPLPVIPRDDGSGVTADVPPWPGHYAGRVERVYAWVRRHPLVVDGPLAAGLLALSAMGDGPDRSSGAGYHAVLIAVSVLLAGLVLFRRRHPAAAFAIAVAAGVAETWVPGPASAGTGPIVAILVLLYTLAAYRPRRISLRGLFLGLAGLSAAVIWSPERLGLHSVSAWLGYGVPMACCWIFGDSVAYRRAHNTWLEERARRAEAERDAKAQLAAAAERSRIAREMHDIIAHNLSVIVGLADGGRYAAARSPERSSQALGAIAGTGREALSELRRLLGVLTEAGDRAADLAPQPGLADLEHLLDRVRAAGLPVRAVMRGDLSGLSEGRQLTVYRIVQEALTNTLKHAGPAATAEVILGYADGAVDVQVTDTGRGAAAGSSDGDGRGLPGLRERAAVYDGTLRAGPGPSGGWRVTAHLPAPQTTVPQTTVAAS